MAKLSFFLSFILFFIVTKKTVLSQDEEPCSSKQLKNKCKSKVNSKNLHLERLSLSKNISSEKEKEIKAKRKRKESDLSSVQKDNTDNSLVISKENQKRDLQIFIDKFSSLFNEEHFHSVYEVINVMKLILYELQVIHNENYKSLIKGFNLINKYIETTLLNLDLYTVIEMHKIYNSLNEHLPLRIEAFNKKLLSFKLNFYSDNIELSSNMCFILDLFKNGINTDYTIIFNKIESILKYKNCVEELPIVKIGSIFGTSNYSCKKKYTENILLKVENIMTNIEKTINSENTSDYSTEINEAKSYLEKFINLLNEEIEEHKEKCINELLKENKIDDIKSTFVSMFLFIQKKKIQNARTLYNIQEGLGLIKIHMNVLGSILKGYNFVNIIKEKYILFLQKSSGNNSLSKVQKDPSEYEKNSNHLMSAYKGFTSLLNVTLLNKKIQSIKKLLNLIENFNVKIIKSPNLNDDDLLKKKKNYTSTTIQNYFGSLKSEFTSVNELFSRDFLFHKLKNDVQNKIDLMLNLRRFYEENEFIFRSTYDICDSHFRSSDDLETEKNKFRKENFILSLFILSQKITDILRIHYT
ncbi:fam-f protein [Plasmodium gallinaceum]|uniref:Fam-f protein n=1 Tax=Plasmodium gallinaceum TaxID=5849 RepID=A0A1J1H0E7_PLAGA|nr:fam-f protein [Plasmodium gallinaceum]CRG97923.1 fam-f protein [Plasmodium gallinaceum]